MKKNSFIGLLLLFFVVDIFFASFTFKNQRSFVNQPLEQETLLSGNLSRNIPSEDIAKISKIKGPRIDDQAVAVERVSVYNTKEKTCLSLPTKIWLFLLFSYIALLIFNLSYNFGTATKIQWFWELLYTLLAIIAWYVWDQCGAVNIWYPEFVLKGGIVIYGIYLYFFEKKQT